MVFLVLDLSKLLMHECYYDKLKKYVSELNLLCMDADSYVVGAKKGSYKIIKEHAEKFDTSDYNRDHECYSPF